MESEQRAKKLQWEIENRAQDLKRFEEAKTKLEVINAQLTQARKDLPAAMARATARQKANFVRSGGTSAAALATGCLEINHLRAALQDRITALRKEKSTGSGQSGSPATAGSANE